MLFLLGLIATPAAAQSDLCWRDPYPWIPGEWVGYGSVIEAGNRFQTVTGATVELWATAYKYDDARQNAIRHQILSATLVETTLSDEHGAFAFKTLQRNKEIRPGSFEIRVHMPGRERGSAYTEIGTDRHHNGWDAELRLPFPGRVRAARASILLDSMTRIAAC